MSLILLIGQKSDPHIKGICQQLSELNEQFIVLDEIHFSDSLCIDFQNGKSNSKLEIANQIIPMSKIKSIWNSTALRIIGKNKLLLSSQEFATTEWTEGINSLWESLDAFWINHPSSISGSANRFHQLQLANNLGLITPKTLITNNPDDLMKFYYDCDQNIVAKTLGSSDGLPEGKMIFTNKISRDHLKNIENLRYAPSFFQEYISKKTEMRITMINSKIHAVEIHSQNSEKTKHDWRHYDDFDKTPYIPVTLDESISKKLRLLLQNLGLNYGAVDMIKTPDNELIFLEVNANGRWWWIQEITGINIAKDVAIALAR